MPAKKAILKGILLALLLFVLVGREASALTQIDSCTTISSPGAYILSASIVDSSASTCVSITSSDVIFDGAGYTIDGIDAVVTYGVYVYNSTTALRNVTVKNLVVTDWTFGITTYYASNGNIVNNIASSNSYGIRFDSSSSNTLTSNTASSNSNSGIWLSSFSSNTITNNTASSNSNSGIWLDSSSSNTLTSNTASSNSYGIYLSSSSSNTLTSNTASSNSYGICLDYSSNGNTLTNNIANSNSNYGIYLYSSSSSNAIYNNYFNNTKNAYDDGINTWNIAKTPGTNIIGGLYLGGNSWVDYFGVDTNGDGLGDTQLPYNSSGSITNGGDYLPLTQRAGSSTDTIPPTSNSPPDASYPQNSTGKTVGWILTDETAPGTYSVTKNGAPYIASIVWVNNTNLAVPVDTSTIGSFTYIISYQDAVGNAGTSDSVTITITLALDTTPPTSNSPSDASYVQGASATIGWVLTDNVAPGQYWVTKDGVNCTALASWGNGVNLAVPVNMSGIGVNTYTIYFKDAVGNFGIPDSVIINSTAPTATGTPTGITANFTEVTPSNEVDVIKQFGYMEFYAVKPELAGVFASLDLMPTSKEFSEKISGEAAIPVKTLEGETYNLASENVLAKYSSASKVIIARGDLGADSIVAASFARSLGVPMLLVKPNEIPSVTSEALEKLGTKEVITIGGEVAISDGVKSKLPSATRIGGKNREETAVKLAEVLAASKAVDTFVLTDSINPDITALTIAVYYNAPIIYTRGDELPPETENFLKSNPVSRIITVGVSPAAKTKVEKFM